MADSEEVMASVHVYSTDTLGKRNFLIENDRLDFGEIPLSQLTSTHIGHRFDFMVNGEWNVLEIVSTYDRFRTEGTRDFAIYATVEKSGPFLSLIRSVNA
jgi:hypothetical protein